MKYGRTIQSSMVILLGISLFSATSFAQAETSSTTTQGLSPMQAATQNKQQGEAFLTANKKKSGVVTLPDGLQYRVIVEGKGNSPSKNDTVTVNYAGTLIDGMEFDSSYKRGEPTTFPVSAVIPGWTEALQLMKAGSTWELYIPPSLAYGERGAPPVIGPNQTLIFKVELISVNK